MLGSWLSARAGDYEVVAQRRDADGPMVDRALELVRKFIVERGLILFGGLAIDYALRLKGDRIYPDDQRPDFDFLSPQSVDDAYDLADRLQSAGFEDVGAVRGIHVQTMRVRTGFIWVADIGYAPPDVFAEIPTFDYRDMRVVHPDYQRMDMHLAFCFPFSGSPREDVFHRWRKDLKRFNLFERHYPVDARPGDARPGDAPTQALARVAVPVIGHDPSTLRVALHGYAAYAVLRAALDELAEALHLPPPAVAAPRLALTFPDDHTIAVALPGGAGSMVTVASPYPAEVLIGPAERYSPYMDIQPESYRAGGLVVLSTKGRRLAASLARVPQSSSSQSPQSSPPQQSPQVPPPQQSPPGAPACVFVVTVHYLLVWLLCEAQRAGVAEEVHRTFYAHTLEIVGAAVKIYADALEDLTDSPKARAAAMDSFAASPFAPTVTTIGDLNLDAAYIIKMASNAARLRDTPPAVLNLEADVANLLPGLPENYYPAKANQHPAFSYDANPLFRRSGQLWV